METNHISFTGTVTHTNGNAIANIRVSKSEKKLLSSILLKETTTNAEGLFSFQADSQILSSSQDIFNTAYIIEAKDSLGGILASSGPLFPTIQDNVVNLTVSNDAYKGDPLFLKLKTNLQPYADELNRKEITEDDILFISAQKNLEPQEVSPWMRASQLEKETNISAQAFYGFFKQGLPTDANSLSAVNTDDMKKALIESAKESFIPDSVAANADEIIKEWNNYIVGKALQEKPEKIDASLGDILNIASVSTEDQKAILQKYLDYQGTIEDFWSELSVTYSEQKVKQIQYALQVSALAGNQPVVTKALLDGSTSSNTDNPIKQFAGWNENDWIAFINNLSATVRNSVVPTFIEDSNENERVKKYAGTISKTLEKTFPTDSFFGKLAKITDTVFNKQDLLTFFGKNPAFDFKTVSPVSLTGYNDFDFGGIADKQSLLKELRQIKRILVYTTNFNALNRLKKDGLDSAYGIVKMPKAKFITAYSGILGSEQEAVKVYSMAETTYMNSAMLWAKYHGSLNLPLNVLPSPIPKAAPLITVSFSPGDVTLRSMFGSLDACECEHCTAVFSAAAYFTDILHFLENRSPDVYNELIRRRPDLIKIKLNCENTNTPLPYVDLVNELLENFVLTHKNPPETVPASYQTTWQTQELAANPENLNYKAYEELEKAVFPGVLPFNLPLVEARGYLKHLNMQRYELMSVFYAGNVTDAFDNASICMERLGISPQEAKILTGETTGDGSVNNGIWNFYGFDKATGFKPITDPLDSGHTVSEGSWFDALSNRVDVFLQQTGLIYKELLSLLLCEFINPAGADDVRRITIVAKALDAEGNVVPPDTCALHLLELQGMETNDLRKIHCFIRLWHKLGWSMYELNKAARTFNLSFGDNIAQNKIDLKKIAQANFLRQQLYLPLDEILPLWSDIDTRNYTNYFNENYPPIVSLYERLFRNKAVLNPVNETFTEDPALLAGNMDDYTPTIFAALQISNTDYGYLKADTTVVADNTLSLANLSSLYRHSVLAKKLTLSVKDFLALKSLTGVDPFSSPQATFKFILKVDNAKTSGFSIDLINYLLRHHFLQETAIAPADDSISVFLSELRGALRTIETSTDEEQKNTIAQKLSENLKITTTASHLLLHDFVKSTVDAGKAIEEDFWNADFSQIDFLKTYTDTSDPLNPINYEPVFVRNGPTTVIQVALPMLFDDYIKLDKIATIIKKLKLSDTELENILKNSAKINCTNLASLPVHVIPNASFEQFETLINLIRSRDSMPVGTPGLFEILNHAIEIDAAANNEDKKAAKDLWLGDLARRSNWDRPTLEALAGGSNALNAAGMLKTNFPDHFCNGDLLLQLKNCLNTGNKVGLNISLIHDTVQEDIADNTISQAIKNAAKSKYDETQWLNIAKPLRDDLREKQREALVAYVIAHSEYDPANGKYERWKNSDELYEYFLIDVEMKPISITSRIKQAICSVQLFIDRVLMNLEHKTDGNVLILDAAQGAEWKGWRKLYRVWEANRKILLYPENWIEPELRNDKSPFFTDLEAQLLQNELNEENVEDAFYVYLEKLDEVARLEIVGLYHQSEAPTADEESINILHVFGRTYSNPHKYFHRTLEKGEWTAWQKIEIGIDGDHLVPVVFNRRLCLFWLFFTEQRKEINRIDPTQEVKAAARYWKIQIAWSEFKKNKWTAKKLSKVFKNSQQFVNLNDASDGKDELVQMALEEFRSKIFLQTGIIDIDNLLIRVQNDGHELSAGGEGIAYNRDVFDFIFTDTNSEPHLKIEDSNHTPKIELPLNTELLNMQITNSSNDDAFYYTKNITSSENDSLEDPIFDSKIILNKNMHGFYKLVILNGIPTKPYTDQLIFQDFKNTFLIEHNALDNYVFPPSSQTSFSTWETMMVNTWNEYLPRPVVNNANNTLSDDIGLNSRKIVSSRNSFIDRNRNNVLLQPENPDTFSTISTILANTSIPGNDNYESNISLFEGSLVIADKFNLKDHFSFKTFYHPHVKTFIKAFNKFGVKGLLNRNMETQPDLINFEDYIPNTSLVATPYPSDQVDFGYRSAYSQYNWELFFHIPMLIACRLKNDQRFEEARKWFHFIFDPTNSESGGRERFWQFKPFYDEAGTVIETLDDLLRNETELAEQVEKWMANPFKPHVIARMRISAFMKNVVLKYLDNLIAWGDQLFSRDTIENINEATNLYILAAKILGERPPKIPPRAAHNELSFDEISPDLDSFSNAMVDIENFISPSISPVDTSAGNSNSLGQMFYFCVPQNEYLLKYWDAVADRLFKIRHSMNIEGIVRTLPLFEPPIDPGMLVRATALGMDLSSILSDINTVMPHYRFNFMLQKANELINEVKGLGSALLQALEKHDAEAMALLRSGHEQQLLQAMLYIKEQQVNDSKETLESAMKVLEIAQAKYQYYSSRKQISGLEAAHLVSMEAALLFATIEAGMHEVASSVALFPNIKVGSPTSAGATQGGHNLGEAAKSQGNSVGVLAAFNGGVGSMIATLAGYERRMDDWKFQTDTSKKEIEQLEKQVLSAEIRLAIAERDLGNHQIQIDNALEADEFMRSKFTNQQLYDWMIGQVSSVYFQSYQLAYNTAKKAEKCFQDELGIENGSYIQFGYWDSLKKGLLSGEKLQYDLRRLEIAYLEQNKRDFEITKHISLALIDPLALLRLKETGACEISLPEELFDLDFPGHYFRKIKSVSLSIPCIAGPYTSVNATLRLTNNRYRIDKTTTNPADYTIPPA
jgi:hypothetical protein